MPREKLRFVNPFRLEREALAESSRPLCHHAHWRFLTVVMSEWDFLPIVYSMSDALYIDDLSNEEHKIDSTLVEKSISNFEAMSTEEVQRWRVQRLGPIRPNKARPCLHLVGKGKLRDSEIEVLVPEGYQERLPPDYYEKFDWVLVKIREGDEDRIGGLFHHVDDGELPVWRRGPGAGDYLCLDVEVRRGTLVRLRREISLRTKPTSIEIHARAYLLQDEVEESLNPVWATDTYTAIYRRSNPAIIAHILLEPRESEALKADDEPEDEPVEPPVPKESTRLNRTDLQPVARALNGLKVPLWLIFGALIASLLFG